MTEAEKGLLDTNRQDSLSADVEWEVNGEIPSLDPNWMVEPAIEHFARSAANLAGSDLKKDHEVATEIDSRYISVIKDHKKEIEIAAGTLIAGLAVAGVLTATKKLRLKHQR